MLTELFHYFLQHQSEISEPCRKRARRDGWHRAVCDYLSGMTDRYAMATYSKIFRPNIAEAFPLT
jgi:dGTPase